MLAADLKVCVQKYLHEAKWCRVPQVRSYFNIFNNDEQRLRLGLQLLYAECHK
jgi:hypothetical protein